MQAIYPFIGGTAYSHKFNLKDPRDTDAACQFQSDIFQAGNISLSGTTETSNGYFIRSLVNSNSSIMKRYRAGTTLTGTLTNAPGGQTSTTFKIGTTLRNYSFVTIGSGLTSDEMDNLNILVQAYQTTLGRQV
jgi:hypothetical protein